MTEAIFKPKTYLSRMQIELINNKDIERAMLYTKSLLRDCSNATTANTIIEISHKIDNDIVSPFHIYYR